MSCPRCHESARLVEYRPETVQGLVGTFPLERAYYHCRSCGHATSPRDETLGLSRQALTPGAREVVCIAGAVDSFGEAAGAVLKKLAGLRVSESTVERTSEAAGHGIGRRQEAGETFGASAPWPWHKDAEGKTCAYVSLDLTGLGMQGPDDGAAAEGRMAAVGVIYNPVPEGPRPVGPAAGARATVPGALRGRARGPGVTGGAAAETGRAGGHGRGSATDRALGRRGGRGGPAAGELRPRRCGDPGLLPRRGTPGRPGAGDVPG
jgi:hypothetical protein